MVLLLKTSLVCSLLGLVASQVLETEQVDPQLILHRPSSRPYEEKLDVTLLPRNHLLTSFDFKLSSEPVNVTHPSYFTHYKTFPRSLAPIIESTNTRELHLRFGQGWWDAEVWGELPHGGEYAGGVGIEIWAVIEAGNEEESRQHWTSLVNSLSGLFCASLNFIDSTKTIFPQSIFKASEDTPLYNETNNLYLLRVALPSEPVCTENLTPFVKFLPTRGKSGLSSLLDGHRIYESQWHMMAIDINTKCVDSLCHFEMNQKIESVVNIERSLRKKFNLIPKPLPGDLLRCDPNRPKDEFQCFPAGDQQDLIFTLEAIFGRSIKGSNLISNSASEICVHTTKDWDVLVKVDGVHFGTETNCFELKKDGKEFDIYFSTQNSSRVNPIKDAPVYVTRSLTGYAQDRGVSRTVFTNPTDDHINLIYLESLPWFMRVCLHTLTVTGGSENVIVKSIYYSPEVDRERPTHIEFNIELPPRSSIALSYSYDKSLLLYSEYPPDANHGFSVEPGVIRVVSPTSYTLRTSPALLTLPTPDFSMPYNVIILTSTIMALSFGTIFNLLFQRVVTEEESDFIASETGIPVKFQKAKLALKNRALRLLGILLGYKKIEKQEKIKEKNSADTSEKAQVHIENE